MENLYSQTDDQGNVGKTFQGISNHRKHENAVEKGDEWGILENNVRKRKATTKG